LIDTLDVIVQFMSRISKFSKENSLVYPFASD